MDQGQNPAPTGSSSNPPPIGQGTCENCGSYGHARDQCPQMFVSTLPTGAAASIPLPANQPLLFCSFCNNYGHTNDQCVTCNYCYSYGHTDQFCPNEMQLGGENPVVPATTSRPLSVQPISQFVQPFVPASNANLTQTRPPQHLIWSGSELIDARLYFSGISPYSQGTSAATSIAPSPVENMPHKS